MKPVPHGEPYAGKLHVRFDEGAGVPDNKGRSALLYTLLSHYKDAVYLAQESKCVQAMADYAEGRISLTACLEECFLLVYECARLGMVLGAWPREVADEAALVITRNWRKFIEAIPDLKRRVLSYENVDARTRKQQMAIESKWRKALDMIEDTYDYGDFEPRPAALAATFF